MTVDGRFFLLLPVSLFFAVGAVGHFALTDASVAVMPEIVPFKREIVWVTGLMEAFFAAALLAPDVRALTGVWVAAFCLAVLPANVNVAIHQLPMGGTTWPAWALWLRVGLQFPFILYILWASGGLGRLRAQGWRAGLPGGAKEDR